MRARHCTPVAVLALSLVVSGVSAQPKLDQNKEAVLFLYKQGKELLEAGKVQEACVKFEDGKHLDPTAINLLLRLGDCYEKLGRAASAERAYREAAAAAAAAKDQRRDAALERAAALAPRVAHLTVVLPGESDVAGLVVKRDGAEIPRGELGNAVAIDPGTYAFEASAPGKVTWTASRDVGAGATSVTLTIPKLADPPAAPADVPASGSAGTRRVLGIVTGAVGLVGVGVGAAFGVKAMTNNNASNNGHCDAQSFCDDTGYALRRAAQQAGTISTAAFVAGATLLAGGVVLVVTAQGAPDARKSALRVEAFVSAAPGGGGRGAIGLRGSF